jgi:hypothetical protein
VQTRALGGARLLLFDRAQSFGNRFVLLFFKTFRYETGTCGLRNCDFARRNVRRICGWSALGLARFR